MNKITTFGAVSALALLLAACGQSSEDTANVDEPANAEMAAAEESAPEPTEAEGPSATERLNAFFEASYEAELMRNPIALTQ